MKFKKPRFLRDNENLRTDSNTPPCNPGGNAYGELDRGNAPTVFNLESEIYNNKSFRTAIWTGTGLQLCVMNIPSGGELGFHRSDRADAFIRLESGYGEILYGADKNKLSTVQINHKCCAVIPSGVFYNLKNTGGAVLRACVIYAQPEHPYGTVDFTKEGADSREGKSSRKI